MKNLELDAYGVQTLNFEEQKETDGGNLREWIAENIFYVTDNGTLLDGIKGNTNIDMYVLGYKIF